MNPKLRRFAPIGLYFALAAVLVSAGLYIVQRAWNIYLQISLACIVLGLALFTALDPERVRTIFTGRQAKYGSNALLMTIAVVGILSVINYLVFKYPQRWDLTENKQRTLAKETLETLKALPLPVHAIAFYSATTSFAEAERVLNDYKYYSKGKFDYEQIDPVKDPVAAQQVNVPLSSGGTIVLIMGDRQEKVTYATEEEMTGALVRLMATKQVVYFLTGHDEYSPDDSGEQGYSNAKSTLEKKNYTVQTLNLLATNTIPEDARVIVIAGPRKPLAENEITLLTNFQAQGGALIVMEEPSLLTDFGGAKDVLAEYLSTVWGITMGDDVVLDLTSQQPYQAFAYQYSNSHAITEKLQRMATAFPTARSVSTTEGLPDVTNTVLIKTAPQSWAETDLSTLQSGGQPDPTQGKDIIGSVPLAVAGQRSGANGRIVVFGDSDFAINANFSYLGNGDLFVNSIDWATEQESLINLTPKDTVTRTMVPPTKVVLGLIFLGSVVLLPGLVIVLGIVVWISRRRRG